MSLRGFDVPPDGKESWTTNAQDGTISVLGAAEKKVIDTLNTNVRSANRLKFTPDGSLVVVLTLGARTWLSRTPDDYVAVIESSPWR
jgi:DNA-binding beta-propeller fold protein YncE